MLVDKKESKGNIECGLRLECIFTFQTLYFDQAFEQSQTWFNSITDVGYDQK